MPAESGVANGRRRAVGAFTVLLAALAVFYAQRQAGEINFAQDPYCIHQSDAIDRVACMSEHGARGIRLALSDQILSVSASDVAVFKALEAMNLIRSVAGSARHAYLSYSTPGFRSPPMDEQETSLRLGFGICGNHQSLFLETMRRLGLRARAVDFYYMSADKVPSNHAAVEILIDGRWRYIDVTWGSYWLAEEGLPSSLMTLEDVLAGRGVRQTGTGAWILSNQHPKIKASGGGPFAYLVAEDVQVLRDKGGVLRVSAENGGIEFAGIPNYVGQPPGTDPLSMQIVGEFAESAVLIEVQSVGGDCKDSSLRLGKRLLPLRAGTLNSMLAPDDVLGIEGSDESCYVVLSRISRG